MEIIEAVLNDIVFQNSQGSYTVMRLSNRSLGRFAAVYKGVAPNVGENLQLTGSWVEHPRFGRQFAVEKLQPVQISSAEGMERFLSSGVLQGVGRVIAQRIVETFKGESLWILEHEPEKLAKIRGISARKAKLIGEQYKEIMGSQELSIFLETNGLSTAYAARIQKAYGGTAITRIQTDPYCLCRDIKGIGFLMADRVALALGFERNAPKRIEAGLAYTLDSVGVKGGHVCLPEPELIRETAKLLACDEYDVQSCYSKLLTGGLMRTECCNGVCYVYPEQLYVAEVATAALLKNLRDRAQIVSRVDVAAEIVNFERQSGFVLADEQREAIRASVAYGVFVLTGGPGTGKTTIVRGIMNVLSKAGCRIALAAPTGRAARRLAESCGQSAKTVHRLLEYQPLGGGYVFGRDEDTPLEADVVIVDEASMLDLYLTYALLRALPNGCRIIFVGDVDQLPSVGAGSVLKDMIASQVLPVVRLHNIFRQNEVSSIVRNAHTINQGRDPLFAPESDFVLREFWDEDQAAAFVAKVYAESVEQHGWRSVQVLSPMHRTACGVDNLNKLLQRSMNSPGPDKQELKLFGNVLREGDKVMQTKNNYEKDVFNGDIGRILEINGQELTVYYPERPEGERVKYSAQEAEELQLAYAMSVHKSQGSEYPFVILLMVPSHYVMLQRNLLYTAVTRAKQKVLVVGERRAVRQAVINNRTRHRYSLLQQRLQDDGNFE